MIRFSCWKYILLKNDKNIFESCSYLKVRNALMQCLELKEIYNSSDEFKIIQESIYKTLDVDIIGGKDDIFF